MTLKAWTQGMKERDRVDGACAASRWLGAVDRPLPGHLLKAMSTATMTAPRVRCRRRGSLRSRPANPRGAAADVCFTLESDRHDRLAGSNKTASETSGDAKTAMGTVEMAFGWRERPRGCASGSLKNRRTNVTRPTTLAIAGCRTIK